MKYFIVRTDLNGKRQYRKNKTLSETWVGESLKGYCWRFSRQGAKKIIDECNKHYGEFYHYSIEPVNDDELKIIELLNILSSYKRLINKNKDYPSVLMDDLEKSIDFVLKRYGQYPHN